MVVVIAGRNGHHERVDDTERDSSGYELRFAIFCRTSRESDAASVSLWRIQILREPLSLERRSTAFTRFSYPYPGTRSWAFILTVKASCPSKRVLLQVRHRRFSGAAFMNQDALQESECQSRQVPLVSIPPHPALPRYYSEIEARQGFLNELFNRTAYQYRNIDKATGFGSGIRHRRKALLEGGSNPGCRCSMWPADRP